MNYIYLHGFASGVQSRKAQFLIDRFAAEGIDLITPDLNLQDFSTVTLSKQLAFLQNTYGGQMCRVMGSSLGGLLATLWAIENPLIDSLVLLAPAYRFRECLQRSIGAEFMAKWEREGVLNFYHYGQEREVALHYEFFVDAARHDENKLERPVPIVIIHGEKDEVVLPQTSQEFAQTRPDIELRIIDSDHSLSNAFESIWQETAQFWLANQSAEQDH